MVDNQQIITADDFITPDQHVDAPSNQPRTPELTGHWWHSQFNLMLVVFALLILSALLFVWLTPPPDTQRAPSNSANTASATSPQSTPAAETPFDESQRQQARADSQDLLAELLATKKVLESKNVKDWAAQPFQAAISKAESGDELYSNKDYAQAIAQYQDSLSDLKALNDTIPQVISQLIAQGRTAIDEGKAELAKTHLNKALTMDKNSIDALAALSRANNLDKVLDLVRNAKVQEQNFATSDLLDDLNNAQSDYQAALNLDDKSKAADAGLQRVTALISDKNFRIAMSKGFKALLGNRYGTATSAFSTALNIKPNDDTAKTAYQQSLAGNKSSSLSSLLATAQRFESKEQWANALGNYQAALQRDPNQVKAKLGVIRSQARSQLDQRLLDVLKDPLSLARESQKNIAQAALNDAQAIRVKGARIKQQISAIENALSDANVVIKVSLSSDNLSDIRLKKDGARSISLGRFTTKNMSLKPGRYVLSATRLGFRDVRQEIQLTTTLNGIQTFTIVCNQPISS